MLLSIASWNNVKGRLSKGYRLTPHADHHLSKQQQNDGSSSGGVIDDDAIEVDASLSSLKQATSSSSAAAAAAGVDHDGDDASDEVDAEAPLVSSSSSSSGASNTADAARSSAFSKRQEENLRRSMRHEGLGSSSSGGAAGSCGGRWFLCSSAFWCCLCSRRGRSKFRSQWHDAMTPVREFFSPSLLRTSLLLMAVWFCLSLGWYGLTLWIPTIFHETNVDLDEYQVCVDVMMSDACRVSAGERVLVVCTSAEPPSHLDIRILFPLALCAACRTRSSSRPPTCPATWHQHCSWIG